MANVKTYGVIYCSDGTEIALLNASTAEGSFVNVQTSTINNYNVQASDIGTAYPGKTIIASTPLQAENNCAAAYLLRAGQIINVLPVAKAGVVDMAKVNLCSGTTLQAGDKIMFMPLAAATRTCSFAVYTNKGQYHIFQGTPSGSGDTDLISILTSNSIGDTLQGQTIVKSYSTSIDGAKLSSSAGGVLVLSDKNEIVGAQVSSAPTLAQSKFMDCSIPIGLNFVARVTTTS